MKIMKDNKGQAMVELAIILPILLLIVMGIIEFGFMINSYLTISNISREGARAAIVGNSYSDIENLIINCSPNLDSSKLNISISPSQESRKSGDTLTVYIIYNYELTVPIISSIFNDTVVLNAQTSMRIE